jgi:phosphoenolpyruvate carboxykinase (ATP)
LTLDAKECGTRQHNVSLVSFKHKMILVAGSGYTGEMKKGVFTVLNYLLPHEKKVAVRTWEIIGIRRSSFD